MKLSSKQAEVLAAEIHSKILSSHTSKIDPHLKSKIEAFKEERGVLDDAVKEAEQSLENHDKKLKRIIGKQWTNKIRNYWDADNIIEEIGKASVPTISQIEDKVILKAMFASADDMEKFVNDMVKDFTKKKNTVLSN
jgi:hypothetical protein